VSLSPTPTAIPRDPGFTVDADGYDPADPERKLIAEVLRHAVKDYSRPKPRGPDRSNGRRWVVRHESAVRFFEGPPSESSFEFLCSSLGMDPNTVRSRLRRKVSESAQTRSCRGRPCATFHRGE
jgi:hypothetical protein